MELEKLLGRKNEIRYNSEAAKIIGVEAAIILGMLVEADDYRQESINIGLDVNLEQSAIAKEKVEDALCTLIRLNILRKESKCQTCSIDYNNYFALLDADINYKPQVDLAKTKVKKTKEEKMAEYAKDAIKTTNSALRSAWYNWIDTIQMKNGYISKAQAELAESIVDSNTNNDDEKLAIINIATLKAYLDISWAVKAFNDAPLKYVQKKEKPNKVESFSATTGLGDVF